MTKKECAQLLFAVKANYPKYYKGISEQEFKEMVDIWQMCLVDYEYLKAQVGVRVYLSSDTQGFPPSVGQIIDCIHKINNSATDIMTEMDAWGFVYKAICNSNYNAEDEFAKLPAMVKDAVGNSARLREWAMLPMNEVQTVIQSNFMRSFKSVQIRQKEMRKLPEDIKKIMNYPEPKAIEDAESGEERIADIAMTVEKEIFSTSNAGFIDSLLEEFKEDYVKTS